MATTTSLRRGSLQTTQHVVDAVATAPLAPDEYDVVLPKNEAGCTFYFHSNSHGRPVFRKHDRLPDGSTSPSERQGLIRHRGDEFVAVDGVPIRDMPYEEARRLLKRCFRTKGFVQLRLRDCRYYKTHKKKRDKSRRQSSVREGDPVEEPDDSPNSNDQESHNNNQRLSKLEEQLTLIESELQQDKELYKQRRNRSIFAGSYEDDNNDDERTELQSSFSSNSYLGDSMPKQWNEQQLPLSSSISDVSQILPPATTTMILSECPSMTTEATTTATTAQTEENNNNKTEDSSCSSPMLDRALALTKSFTSLMTQEKNLMDTMTEMNHMIDTQTSDWGTPDRSEEDPDKESSSSCSENGQSPPSGNLVLNKCDTPRRRRRQRPQPHEPLESESEVASLRQSVIRLEKQLARQKEELAQHRQALVTVAQKLQTERSKQGQGACCDGGGGADNDDDETDAVLRNLLLLVAVSGCLFRQSIGNSGAAAAAAAVGA